jgi:hypothetical protein
MYGEHCPCTAVNRCDFTILVALLSLAPCNSLRALLYRCVQVVGPRVLTQLCGDMADPIGCMHFAATETADQYECVLGLIILPISIFVTTACARRTGAAASVERRRCKPDRTISPSDSAVAPVL